MSKYYCEEHEYQPPPGMHICPECEIDSNTGDGIERGMKSRYNNIEFKYITSYDDLPNTLKKQTVKTDMIDLMREIDELREHLRAVVNEANQHEEISRPIIRADKWMFENVEDYT